MKSVSVSQIEKFDHRVEGGCANRWFLEDVHGLKPDQDDAQGDGIAGHNLLGTYFATGALPAKRTLMGKAVTGAIFRQASKEHGPALPTPGPDLMVESRFSGQPQYDVNGNWIPLDASKTLVLAGVPLDGHVDLRYRRGRIPSVGDHKFSNDPETYAKEAKDLIKTIQMPVYVLDSMRIWPDAREFRIWHHNVSRKGVLSFIRHATVTVDWVLARRTDIEKTIEAMKVVEATTDQRLVPFNRKSCHAWSGCPMQSHCHAFKENKMNPLSPEDQALFNELDGLAPPVVNAPPVRPTPHEVDDMPVQTPDSSLQAADTAAARKAKMKAELAAMEAEEAKEAEAARLAAIEAAKPKPIVCPLNCGSVLTPENSSKLASGLYKHIGCPKDQVSIVPKDAPASNPALASEQPAPAAEPKKPKGKAADPLVVTQNGTQTITHEIGPVTLTLIRELIDVARAVLKLA